MVKSATQPDANLTPIIAPAYLYTTTAYHKNCQLLIVKP